VNTFNEKPVRAAGGPGRAAKAKTATTLDVRATRALERFLIARTALTFAGRESSTRAQLQVVREAIAAGVITVAKVPSAATVRRLVAKQTAAPETTVDTFKDGEGRGRKPLAINERILTLIKDAVRTKRPGSIRRVHQAVVKRARVLKLHAPSYGTVYKLYREEGVLLDSASQHGRDAAELDGVTHSTVPAPYTHDVWTLDEFTLPIWCRYYDLEREDWVSFKPTVVIVIDNCSRVIVGYWVCDPQRRFHRKDSPNVVRKGADATDVLATLIGAACPEAAPTATRRYAGYLPNALRWDRAKAHLTLVDKILSLNIAVPDLPGERPPNRGIIERPIGTLKDACDTVIGYAHEYAPTDQPGAENDEAQEDAAGQSRRVRTRTPIEPTYLCDVKEVRAHFDEIVRRYNDEHQHRELEGLTPRQAYPMRMRPRSERRAGRDILPLLKTRVATVQKDGIVYWNRGSSYHFAAAVGPDTIALGTSVNYRPDPMLRGLFAEHRGATVFLKPLGAWAAEQDPAVIAEGQRAAATLAAMDAMDARDRNEALAIGFQVKSRMRVKGAARAAEAAGLDAPDELSGSRTGKRGAGPEPTVVPPHQGADLVDAKLKLDDDVVGMQEFVRRRTSPKAADSSPKPTKEPSERGPDTRPEGQSRE
jgi:transposase InsO family protein